MANLINRDTKRELQVLERTVPKKAKPKLERPAMYRVVMLNDDYTPMDFVVVVLEIFFGLATGQAVQVMLDVHQKGEGVCGTYTRDVAQTKAMQVREFASLSAHPLLCRIEKAE